VSGARIAMGFLLYPRMTQLDLTGPHEVLSRLPTADMHLIAKSMDLVFGESGLGIMPTATLETAAPLDVICVPGGRGVDAMLSDDSVLSFLVAQSKNARFVTAVCTGALLLGSAGLLSGYKATTHWMSIDLLGCFGATPVRERVVVDRSRVTSAGVTAGIELGFALARELAGDDVARELELVLEYDPVPLFAGGSPRTARRDIVERVSASRAESQAARRRLVEAAAARQRASGRTI
jgi:cyclohexyl-isocyanide hydratase